MHAFLKSYFVMRLRRFGWRILGWWLWLWTTTTTIRRTLAAPDLARCFMILSLSDVDENQHIEYFEFEAVAVYYGCPYESMEFIFRTAACVCQSYEKEMDVEAAESDCCDAIYRPDSQRYATGYILQVCHILETMCSSPFVTNETTTSGTNNSTNPPSVSSSASLSPSSVAATTTSTLPTTSSSTVTPAYNNKQGDNDADERRSTSRKWITGFVIGLGGSLVFTSFMLLIVSTMRKVLQSSSRNRNTTILGRTVVKGNMDGNDVFIDITSTGQLSSNCDEAQHCCDDEEDREGQVPYVEHFNDDSTSTSDRSTIHCNNNNTNDLEPNDHASWWSHSLSDSALIHNVRNDTAVTHNSSGNNNNIHYAYDFSGISATYGSESSSGRNGTNIRIIGQCGRRHPDH